MKLYRSSGAPIKPEHKELYFKDLNKAMDALEEELGKCNADNASEFQKRMELIHRNLTKSYPNMGNIVYPRTIGRMRELIETYGTLAFCVEDDKLVCYIMDS
jgi:hypothetical protein